MVTDMSIFSEAVLHDVQSGWWCQEMLEHLRKSYCWIDTTCKAVLAYVDISLNVLHLEKKNHCESRTLTDEHVDIRYDDLDMLMDMWRLQHLEIITALYRDRILIVDVCKIRIMYLVCRRHLPIGYSISQLDQDGMYDVRVAFALITARWDSSMIWSGTAMAEGSLQGWVIISVIGHQLHSTDFDNYLDMVYSGWCKGQVTTTKSMTMRDNNDRIPGPTRTYKHH